MEPVKAVFFEPDASLRRALTAYYFLEMPPGGATDLLHPDWFNIRFFVRGAGRMRSPGRDWLHAPAAGVLGPIGRAPLIQISGLVAAVGLLPYGWARLVGLSADGFADTVRPAVDALGSPVDALFERLRAYREIAGMRDELDAFFLSLFRSRPEPPDIVERAHHALMCPAVRTVEQWAARLEVSARHLERVSLTWLGMSPKKLLRRQRFLSTMAALREVPPGRWARLLDGRYADQAQFSREFKFFMGLSPSEYFASPRPIMGPAADARKRALGQPAQALHPPGE